MYISTYAHNNAKGHSTKTNDVRHRTLMTQTGDFLYKFTTFAPTQSGRWKQVGNEGRHCPLQTPNESN